MPGPRCRRRELAKPIFMPVMARSIAGIRPAKPAPHPGIANRPVGDWLSPPPLDPASWPPVTVRFTSILCGLLVAAASETVMVAA